MTDLDILRKLVASLTQQRNYALDQLAIADARLLVMQEQAAAVQPTTPETPYTPRDTPTEPDAHTD